MEDTLIIVFHFRPLESGSIQRVGIGYREMHDLRIWAEDAGRRAMSYEGHMVEGLSVVGRRFCSCCMGGNLEDLSL